MLPGLLLSIFFWAIHQFINADVKDLCENIQLNVFDHPLAAFNALYGVFINVKPFWRPAFPVRVNPRVNF